MVASDPTTHLGAVGDPIDLDIVVIQRRFFAHLNCRRPGRPVPNVAAIRCAAAVASTMSKRNAFAMSSRSPAPTGRSPRTKRRMARSSMPSRREAAVVPPRS